MDFETVPAPEFGASLRGIGLNLLCRDVRITAAFLQTVFDMQPHRLSNDFAIMTYGPQVFQLHADGTFATHPLYDLLPETPPRGAGVQIYLYDTDPDIAAARAAPAGGILAQAPENKPHGLRECVILDPDGFAWSPARPLTATERAHA